MRILHVSFGFRPWIVNGLVIYAESVMDAQVNEGHEVGYFFAARQLPWLRRPFLHGWRRGGVRMFEIVNSSLVVGRHRGTPDPGSDLDHAPSERAFERVLRGFRPQVIHVHDLGGLPSSLLDVARRAGVPIVMTLHDYHPLCPTVKLYDAYDRICARPDPGAMCAVCCADAPVDNSEDRARTIADVRRRVRASIPPLDAALGRPRGERLGVAGIRLMERAAGIRRAETSPGAPGPNARARPAQASPEEYQRRRDVNLERLDRVDALVAGSRRCAQIYRELGVRRAPIHVVPINPPHIARLQPKRRRAPADPIRFVVLNACNSTQKGADLVVRALADLSARRLDDRYRLIVHGAVAPHVQAELAAHPAVELRGPYRTDDLDRLLEDADVGLFPSVWEEVYGFVGLEFLAKGIPVIGNAIGAIPDFIRPEETGWLNLSCSAPELAALMAQAIDDPATVRGLGETAIELRAELILPVESGVAELHEIYRRILAARGRG